MFQPALYRRRMLLGGYSSLTLGRALDAHGHRLEFQWFGRGAPLGTDTHGSLLLAVATCQILFTTRRALVRTASRASP